jgi:hypothetical protein
LALECIILYGKSVWVKKIANKGTALAIDIQGMHFFQAFFYWNRQTRPSSQVFVTTDDNFIHEGVVGGQAYFKPGWVCGKNIRSKLHGSAPA